LNSDNETATEEELVNMMYDDDAYGLKSVCANDTHELLYLQTNIEIERDQV